MKPAEGIVSQTALCDVWHIKSARFSDDRGYFAEAFALSALRKKNILPPFSPLQIKSILFPSPCVQRLSLSASAACAKQNYTGVERQYLRYVGGSSPRVTHRRQIHDVDALRYRNDLFVYPQRHCAWLSHAERQFFGAIYCGCPLCTRSRRRNSL